MSKHIKSKAKPGVANITEMLYVNNHQYLYSVYGGILDDRLIQTIIDNSNNRYQASLALYNAWGNEKHEYKSPYEDMLRNDICKYNEAPTVYSSETCRKCNQKKLISYELQLRSCDEPSTIFKVCTNCSFTQKI